MAMCEQYREMRSYVDAMLPDIEARCDPSRWSDNELSNLQELSSQGLSFMNQILRVTRAITSHASRALIVETCRRDPMPLAIGKHICVAMFFIRSSIRACTARLIPT